MLKRNTYAVMAGVLLALGSSSVLAADAETQAQLDALKAAIPKFAVPMREVGGRFQDMYFAAKGGNWALAAYMSKYMNGAMNPAALTKPKEYKMWKDFYVNDFAMVNKAIQAKDMKAFEESYTKAIVTCNECHETMKYQFIKVVKKKTAPGNNIDFTLKTEPNIVPD